MGTGNEEKLSLPSPYESHGERVGLALFRRVSVPLVRTVPKRVPIFLRLLRRTPGRRNQLLAYERDSELVFCLPVLVQAQTTPIAIGQRKCDSPKLVPGPTHLPSTSRTRDHRYPVTKNTRQRRNFKNRVQATRGRLCHMLERRAKIAFCNANDRVSTSSTKSSFERSKGARDHED